MLTFGDFRRWLARHRRVRRVLFIVMSVYLLGVLTMPFASAVDATSANVGGPWSWLNVTDSNGTSVWQYTLNIHMGGVHAPLKAMFGGITLLLWELYRLLIAVSCWLVNFVLDFGWVDVIVTPFRSLYVAIDHIVDAVGIAPFLVFLAGVIIAVWLVAGRAALAISELFISGLVIALFSGVWANPIDVIAGRDGVLYDARDFGLELAVVFHDPDNPDSTPKDDIPNVLTASMVDSFVRSAHQMTNYGRSLESADCVDYYNESLAMSDLFPTASDEPRKQVRNCSEEAFEYAENTGPAHAMTVAAAMPATVLLLVLSILLSVFLLLAVLSLLWQGAKSVVTGMLGVVPGVLRGALLQTVAQALIAWATIPALMAFQAGYLTLISNVFAGDLSWFPSPMAVLVFIDILAAVGIFALWRARRSLKNGAGGLANLLAWRPAAPERRSGRTPMPAQSMREDVKKLSKAAVTAYGYHRLFGRAGSASSPRPSSPAAPPRGGPQPPPPVPTSPGDGPPPRGGPQPPPPVPTSPGDGPPPRGGPGATPNGPQPGGKPGPKPRGGIPGGGGSGARRALRFATRAAAKAALASATGGASTVALAGGKAAAAAASRGAIAGKAARKLTAGSQLARDELARRLSSSSQVGAATGPARTPAGPAGPTRPKRPSDAGPANPADASSAGRPPQRRFTRIVKDGQVLLVPTDNPPPKASPTRGFFDGSREPGKDGNR